MTYQEFIDQQKANFTARYHFLNKEQKMKRDEALNLIASENDMSYHTVSSIIYRSNYYKSKSKKSTPSQKSNT